jgi:hypothetical protein
MVKKIISCFIIVFLISLGFFYSPVLAQNSADKKSEEPPEIEGTYDVPGKPNLKVRVFVHHPKPSASPVTTCLDPDSTLPVSLTGWQLPVGDWVYRLNVASVPLLVGSNNLDLLSNAAFSAWSSAINNKVHFVRGSDTVVDQKRLDGQNIVSWGRTSGTALAVTYTWYYPSTGLVAEVDTIMNKKFPWSWTPYTIGACGLANTYDAQDILTHELGHWLGLNDMYDAANYQNATMYGYGAKAEIKKDTLTQSDKAGLAQIYH